MYRAVHRVSGESVAVKVIDKNGEDYFQFQDVIENEIKMIEVLPKNPKIIEFYEVERGLLTENRNRRQD